MEKNITEKMETLEGKVTTLERNILSLQSQVGDLLGITNIKVDKDKILEAINQAKGVRDNFR